MLHESSSDGFLSGNPKTMFLFGLVTGFAGALVIGLVVILSLLVSGKTLLPGSGSNTVAVAPTPTIDPNAAAPVAGAPVKPVDEKTDHIRGAKNAKVTLIEYSDFQCPYCARHVSTLEQALKDYPNDVRLIYRHFPLSFHPEAQKAAEATECASQQGKFWEMHDEIFKANIAQTMSINKWKEVAATLKLDTAKFNKCLDSGETAAAIAQQTAEGGAAGVQGTPGTFVNGILVEGAVPYAEFKQAIDQQLKS